MFLLICISIVLLLVIHVCIFFICIKLITYIFTVLLFVMCFVLCLWPCVKWRCTLVLILYRQRTKQTGEVSVSEIDRLRVRILYRCWFLYLFICIAVLLSEQNKWWWWWWWFYAQRVASLMRRPMTASCSIDWLLTDAFFISTWPATTF